MEPGSSLPHSQEHTTCPYHEPDQSSPYSTSKFVKINFNIILTSTPTSFKWSLSLRSPQQNSVCTTHISPTYYISCPSHPYLFVQPHNILRVQILNLLVNESYNTSPSRILTTYILFWGTGWCSWLRNRAIRSEGHGFDSRWCHWNFSWA